MKKRRITVNINSTIKYIQLWNGIFNLTSKEIEILSHFIEVNAFKQEENVCSVSNKKDVAAIIGLNDYNTLNNYIKRFKDKQVMIKKKSGYVVNPFLDMETTNVEVIIKHEHKQNI